MKNHVEPIDDLNDLNGSSTDVNGILAKIDELKRSGFDLLNRVPDNGAICSIKLKYYIPATISHARKQCDYCVARYVNKESPLELNVSCNCFNFPPINISHQCVSDIAYFTHQVDQKKCALGVLETAKHELDTMSDRITTCIENTF